MAKNNNKDRTEQFLKQFVWLLEDYKDIDIKEYIVSRESNKNLLDDYVPENQNIFFLTGCLPSLFKNDRYFPTNYDLFEFCKKYIGIAINRYEKKSRTDLIGQIVCEISNITDDSKLDKITKALKSLLMEIDKGKRNPTETSNETLFRNWKDMLDEVYK